MKSKFISAPVVPFTADVWADAKDGVHAGFLHLLEEPHDVVVPLEVILKNQVDISRQTSATDI